MALTTDELRGLLEATWKSRERELTCDELLDVMAELAEARAAGVALPAELKPFVEHHLALCPSCAEELEALVAALAP
jgi:hypothetical protein